MSLVLISPPEDLPGEVELVNELFGAGLPKYHLRKPNATKGELASYMLKLDRVFWDRVVIHDAFDVALEFPVAGFHFKSQNIAWINRGNLSHKSYSAHSMDEIIELNHLKLNYIFLSPVYESISKPGYKNQLGMAQIEEFLTSGKATNPLFALGGIDEGNMDAIKKIGFSGAAIMGAIWKPLQDRSPAVHLVNKFLRMNRAWEAGIMY